MPDGHTLLECVQVGKHLYCHIPQNFAGWMFGFFIGVAVVSFLLAWATFSIVRDLRDASPKRDKQPPTPLTPA